MWQLKCDNELLRAHTHGRLTGIHQTQIGPKSEYATHCKCNAPHNKSQYSNYEILL